MKCPECSTKFLFKNVPLEDRVINAFSTSFKCPECRILLKPDKKFEIVSNISILIITASILGLIFKDFLNIGLSYQIMVLIGGIGMLIWYINSKKTRLNKVINRK